MSYLTEERQMIQQTARDFAMNEVLPVANKLDPEQGDIPMDLRAKMGKLGFFGIMIPEEYGGQGLGAMEYVLITEELARAWMSVASIIARGNGMGAGWTEAQRREFLPKMARGEFLGAAALSEPDAGSDLANVSCKATRDGDGWVINGTKTWCTFADGANFITLLARTRQPSDPRRRHEGISQFVILKEPGEFPPGMTASSIRKIGYFGWKTWELHFDNFRLPADALMGRERENAGEGRAFYSTAAFLAVARVHTAARAVGLARGGLEDALAYSKKRVAFGHPIGDFQAIRFKLANMATEIEAARQLTYYAADQVDQRNTNIGKEASMAKLFASEMAERVTSEALQIHGGYGYTKDFPLERYWRDARLTKIFEGTSEIQLRIISDNLLGRGGRTDER
jgi:alkylation response protein AidB-like acyl-CoA dehydrogenase